MPELPEVQTTVDGLKEKVLNRTFVDIWSDWPKIVKKPKDLEAFRKELKDKKIKRIWRRAKNVIFDLSDSYSLLIHQKMTGHLLVGKWRMANGKWQPVHSGPLEEKTNAYIHLMFFLRDEKMIALSDLRKFAKAELWKTAELLESQEFKNLGPEPLEKSFTLEIFKNSLKNKKGTIKQVLMDQSVIAGIGNIYASEILWWIKIHPAKKVFQLTDEEIKLLHTWIKKVLQMGIRLGGESFADYRNVEGKKGNFDDARRAYRREGEKCFRCGTPIKRLKAHGRSAFFCPLCQKL